MKKIYALLAVLLLTVSCFQERTENKDLKESMSKDIPEPSMEQPVDAEIQEEVTENEEPEKEYPTVTRTNIEQYFDKAIQFPALSDDEVLSYARIDSINWGIRFVARSRSTKEERIIGEWADCMSEPQIIKNGKGCFFSVLKYKKIVFK